MPAPIEIPARMTQIRKKDMLRLTNNDNRAAFQELDSKMTKEIETDVRIGNMRLVCKQPFAP